MLRTSAAPVAPTVKEVSEAASSTSRTTADQSTGAIARRWSREASRQRRTRIARTIPIRITASVVVRPSRARARTSLSATRIAEGGQFVQLKSSGSPSSSHGSGATIAST